MDFLPGNPRVEIVNVADNRNTYDMWIYSTLGYYTDKNGIVITDMTIDDRYLNDWYVIIIPEYISGKRVVSIVENSFMSDGKGFPNFVIPYSVKKIEKGAFTEKKRKNRKSYFWIALEPYYFYRFNDRLTIMTRDNWKQSYVDKSDCNYINNDLYIYGKHIQLSADLVLKREIKRPRNGIWDYDGTLFRYSGKKERVIINSHSIAPYAFYNNQRIEEIVFQDPNMMGTSHMIDSCRRLVEISISKNAKVPDDWINNCTGLRNIEWRD